MTTAEETKGKGNANDAVRAGSTTLATRAIALRPGPASAQYGAGVERKLAGKTAAILVAEAFEQVELTGPRKALEAAGAKTVLVSQHGGQVRAWNLTNWGDKFDVDLPLDQARPEPFDALLLPGGVGNPDLLRTNSKAVKFVRAFFDAAKPVASICHGPWTLIKAGFVKGLRMLWAITKDRPPERWGNLGEQGGADGQQPRHQRNAIRHPGLQLTHDRPFRGRQAGHRFCLLGCCSPLIRG